MMNECDHFTSDELLQYLDGKHPDERRDEMKRHIISCTPCTRALQKLDELRTESAATKEEKPLPTSRLNHRKKSQQMQPVGERKEPQTVSSSKRTKEQTENWDRPFFSDAPWIRYVLGAGVFIGVFSLLGYILEPYLLQNTTSKDKSTVQNYSATGKQENEKQSPREGRKEQVEAIETNTPPSDSNTSSGIKQAEQERKNNNINGTVHNQNPDSREKTTSAKPPQTSWKENQNERRKDSSNPDSKIDSERTLPFGPLPLTHASPITRNERNTSETQPDTKIQQSESETSSREKKQGSEIKKESTTAIQPGDVNGDGIINVTDSMLITRAVVNEEVTEENRKQMDANGDGSVDITDARFIMQKFIEHGNQSRKVNQSETNGD